MALCWTFSPQIAIVKRHFSELPIVRGKGATQRRYRARHQKRRFAREFCVAAALHDPGGMAALRNRAPSEEFHAIPSTARRCQWGKHVHHVTLPVMLCRWAWSCAQSVTETLKIVTRNGSSCRDVRRQALVTIDASSSRPFACRCISPRTDIISA